jgi:dienelactone hydrolase
MQRGRQVSNAAVLYSGDRTAECIKLVRQGTVQSELPILVLFNESDEHISASEEMTGLAKPEARSS